MSQGQTDRWTDTHTLTHTNINIHTCVNTHARTHARTHTHIHTHQSAILDNVKKSRCILVKAHTCYLHTYADRKSSSEVVT